MNHKIEKRIYEFLGVNSYRKFILNSQKNFSNRPFLKIILRILGLDIDDMGRHKISNFSIEGLEAKKSYAKSNAFTHGIIFIIKIAYLLYIIASGQFIALFVIAPIFLPFLLVDSYSLMAQRQHTIRINEILEKLEKREERKKNQEPQEENDNRNDKILDSEQTQTPVEQIIEEISMALSTENIAKNVSLEEQMQQLEQLRTFITSTDEPTITEYNNDMGLHSMKL